MSNETQPGYMMEKTKFTLPIIYLLGALEFVIAAIAILFLDPDPKNSLFLGYSLQRIALFCLILSPGLALLVFARLSWQGKLSSPVINWLAAKLTELRLAALCLALVAFMVLITPPDWLGGLGGYFRHLQLFLLVLFTYPAQLLLPGMLQNNGLAYRSWVRPTLVFSGLMTGFWLIILFSGLGNTPVIAGTPFTTFEWVLGMVIMLAGWYWLAPVLKHPGRQALGVDIGIILGLTILTALVWARTPFKGSTFLEIAGPYFQPYPQSDAAIHDLGALSILQGKGINFGGYTDKPLYMVFLAILHSIAGYNYSLLVFLQICFLALMAPALYWLGKSFHSRPAGILSGLLVLLHQRNSIQLSNLLFFNAAPNMLMTEVPTLLSIILLTVVWFAWMKQPRTSTALAAGGILGISSLLRLNSFLILPFIPIFALLVTPDKKKWFVHCMAYMLGFFILVAPWLMTGQDGNGNPYFMVKFYDVINVRYGETSAPINKVNPSPTEETVNKVPAQPANQTPPQPAGVFDVNHFPGFIFYNFLHNLKESVLELPDSLNPQDQILTNLGPRFYWEPGSFENNRIPLIILNSLLIALGLAWSWKRWHWPGMTPLLIFLVYSLSLALARTSGSRYLVPIDWLIFFYFSLGALTILDLFLPDTYKTIPVVKTRESNIVPALGISPFWNFWGVLIVLVVMAALIPVASKLIPNNPALCQTGDLSAVVNRQAGVGSTEGLIFRKGVVLYPASVSKQLTFNLLSCGQVNAVTIKNPIPMPKSGDMVIVGWLPVDPEPQPIPLSVLIPVK